MGTLQKQYRSKLNLSSQIIENDSDLPSHPTSDIGTRLIIIPSDEIDFVIDNLADKLACNVLRIHSGNLGKVLLREHLQGLAGGLSLNGYKTNKPFKPLILDIRDLYNYDRTQVHLLQSICRAIIKNDNNRAINLIPILSVPMDWSFSRTNIVTSLYKLDDRNLFDFFIDLDSINNNRCFGWYENNYETLHKTIKRVV